MKDIKCPYCDADLEINHDDGYGYAEGVKHQQECGQCEKTFVFTTSISLSYEAEKSDCLNGAEHDWKPTTTFPKQFTRMVCTMCEEERTPTESEMEEIMKVTAQ